MRQIELRNVRVNNLKGIDLDVPHGQWVSICGLSGSGKSSLALDTLYAEGQRRYLESLSPSTRQFLQQLDKPDADRIDGIPPAVAVKATRGKPGPHSTVGSATEVIDYLRLLFVQVASVICPQCGQGIDKQDPDSLTNWLSTLNADTRYQVGFDVDLLTDPLAKLENFRRNGFGRIVLGETTLELGSSLLDDPQLMGAEHGTVIVDRLKSGSSRSRIRESLETAFRYGRGSVAILIAMEEGENVVQLDGCSWQRSTFSLELKCSNCGFVVNSPTAPSLSYNSPQGACADCNGTGETSSKENSQICLSCNGTRLNKNALGFQLGGKSIAQVANMELASLMPWLDSTGLETSSVSQRLISLVRQRVKYLLQVGLGYLHLNRAVATLSDGEAQRVSLTSCLSSTLVNMLYVLDEPSMGLHPHDIGRLKDSVAALHQRKNTVVVVDHEATMIQAAERVVEIGPSAGESGGEVVFDGTPEELIQPDAESLTGMYVGGLLGVSCGDGSRRTAKGRIKLTGATGNNLKDIHAEFPLGVMCVVTGVSGAGKSSLVQNTLYGAIMQRKDKKVASPLPFSDLFGDTSIEEVVLIDRTPIGRSARSNPVTYVKAFDEIRKTFAETAEAQSRNLKAGSFSFNVSGGRCERCEGDGCLTVDMQFLPDVVIKCDECLGTRFKDEVLAVKYRGKNISEVLNLTVRQAFTFFRGQPKIQAKLKNLIDVGLEYIRLGQPATRLSTGEAQRLKLATYLNANRKGRSLFLLDEPTNGLHMRDVVRLLDCFNALLDVGHSMIIVEHNLQLIKQADWIIDLGPGAAAQGGEIVAQGTPETIAENEDSLTGQYLKPLLELVADD